MMSDIEEDIETKKIKCGKCLVLRDETYYHQIIRRRDWGVDSDDDGYSFFIKNTKLCIHCRTYLRDRLKDEKNKK